VRVTFWGTRGSIATPGPETVVFGGDTSCVAIAGRDPGHLVILDAGTGLRRLGNTLPEGIGRIDLLLSHLHLDHILGLGFFAPFFREDLSVTIWAPPSRTPLLDRLSRYLSPPLFPVRLRDVSSQLHLRDAGPEPISSGEFTISAASIIHPDTALGYRIEGSDAVVAYLPDHEPALSPRFPTLRDWTSGAAIASDVDLLIHDGQYRPEEYVDHVGWGHSSATDSVAFADLVAARTLALFHHDPGHDDAAVAELTRRARAASHGTRVMAAKQGSTITLGH